MGTLVADVDKWEISLKRITLEEVIGSGSFGTVWRAVLIVEMDNQAYILLQQSALHVSTLPIQFHSCTSLSHSAFIIFECSFLRIPLFIPS